MAVLCADGPSAQQLRSRAQQVRVSAEARALLELRLKPDAGLPPPTVAEQSAAAAAAYVAGTVVWAHVKGWPAWPALVMTHEDALNVRVAGESAPLSHEHGERPYIRNEYQSGMLSCVWQLVS